MRELKRLGPGAALLAAMLLLSAAPAAEAQGSYPAAQDPYVNDFAGRLASRDVDRIRLLLSQARQATGVHATAVVIDSIHGYGTSDRSIESFATRLFNAWGVGDAVRNDGVLFLVALGDRQVRIELGAGYGDRQSAAMQQVVDQRMLPRFRAGDFGGGIYDGASAALATLAGWRPPAEPAPAGAPGLQASGLVSQPAEQPPSGTTRRTKRPAIRIPWRTVGVLASLLLGVGAAGVGIWRRRHRKCPFCTRAMTKFDEIADDMYLTEGQQAEESVRSVDYDVWRCGSCNFTDVVPYRRWFTSYKECPHCKHRTVYTESLTLVEPTYESGGQKKVTRTCSNCDFADSDILYLPQLTRSTSDGGFSADWSTSSSSGGGSSAGQSSSSFGGGSSAGHGASGSW